MILKIVATVAHCFMGFMSLSFVFIDDNFEATIWQHLIVIAMWLTILVAIWVR